MIKKMYFYVVLKQLNCNLCFIMYTPAFMCFCGKYHIPLQPHIFPQSGKLGERLLPYYLLFLQLSPFPYTFYITDTSPGKISNIVYSVQMEKL